MFGTIYWISYKGKEILFNNRSNLKPDESSYNSHELVKLVLKSNKKNILYLVDNRYTIFTPDTKERIKKGGIKISRYIKKTAVVGASDTQKILLKLLSSITGMKIKLFDDIEEAKDWLVV